MVLIALSAALAGCGGSAPATLSSASASALHRDVANVRAAAAGGETVAARAAVATFRGDVVRLTARGELARSDAAVLLVDAKQIDALIAAGALTRPAPPTTSTTTMTTTTSESSPPPAAPPGHARRHGKGHGDGKGDGGGRGHG